MLVWAQFTLFCSRPGITHTFSISGLVRTCPGCTPSADEVVIENGRGWGLVRSIENSRSNGFYELSSIHVDNRKH